MAINENDEIVGYVQGKVYETKSLIFNQTSFKQATSIESADTLMVDEIAVLKSLQGKGIGGKLLDTCIQCTSNVNDNIRLRDSTGFLQRGFEDTSLRSVLFSVRKLV